MLAHRARYGFGNRAHAAPGEAPGADVAVHVAHHVVQQNVGGAGRLDAERGADDARRRHGGLDQVVLEVVLQELGGAHGEKADVLVDLLLAHRPELLGQEQQLRDVPGAQPRRVGRRAQQRLADELGIAGEVRLEAVHGIGIVGRVALQFEVGGGLVVVGDQPFVAVAEVHGAQVRHQNQAVPAQVQVAVDGLAHHAAHVGAVGVGEALVQLPGHRRAADVVVPLQHHHLQPGLGEIGRIGQAVVAGADDDGVVGGHCSISRAALCPGAPVRSPPGWLPAPHRYSPGMGVRYWAAW